MDFVLKTRFLVSHWNTVFSNRYNPVLKFLLPNKLIYYFFIYLNSALLRFSGRRQNEARFLVKMYINDLYPSS